jgi:hypothetical protein
LFKVLDVSYIIEELLKQKRTKEAESITLWPGAANEENIVRVLVLAG